MLVFVVVTVALGNWQRHRAADKDALRAQLDASSRQPPVDLAVLPGDTAAARFRRVRVQGTFDASRQMLLDNRVRGGRVGYDVVTPLRIAASGSYVLVDRGWIAQGASRAQLPRVDPPSGPVTVEGRINLPARYLELAKGPASGPVIENLDIARIAASSGLSLAPFVIEQTGDSGSGLVQDWPAPDFGAEQNRSYMMQWYAFAGIAVVLWLTLNWRAKAKPR
jgi:surfeit locus 1 family protein